MIKLRNPSCYWFNYGLNLYLVQIIAFNIESLNVFAGFVGLETSFYAWLIKYDVFDRSHWYLHGSFGFSEVCLAILVLEKHTRIEKLVLLNLLNWECLGVLAQNVVIDLSWVTGLLLLNYSLSQCLVLV